MRGLCMECYQGLPQYGRSLPSGNRLGYIILSKRKASCMIEKTSLKLNLLRSSLFHVANSHFLRPAGPHFPASQGHIKRPVLEIGRAERGLRPANQYRALSQKAMLSQSVR